MANHVFRVVHLHSQTADEASSQATLKDGRAKHLSTMGTMTTAQWHMDAAEKVTMALKVLRMADTHSQAHARAYFLSKRDGSQHKARFKAMHAADKNTYTVKRLSVQLKDRINATSKVLASLKRSLAEQKVVASSHNDQLRVCICRSQMRDKRPAMEKVQDGCEVGLERERDVLQKAYDDGMEQMCQKDQLIIKVEDVLEKLRDEEYHVISISGCESPSLMPVSPSHNSNPRKVKLTNREEERLEETAQLLKKAHELEHEAASLIQMSQETMRRSVSDAGRAHRMVVAELTKRVSETMAIKKRLEFLLSEIENRIKDQTFRVAWRGLEGQDLSIELEQPRLETVRGRESVHFKVMKKRMIGGHKYMEPESGDVEQVHPTEGMKAAGRDCRKPEVTGESIEGLSNMRDELRSELYNKTAALQIDLACQRAKCVDGEVVFPEINASQDKSNFQLKIGKKSR